MWSTIGIHDIAGVEHYVTLSRPMDSRYDVLSVGGVRSSMKRHRGEIHHYAGNGFEIVMMWYFSPRWRTYYIWSIGLAGDITPEDALELLVPRARWFLQEHDLEFFYAIRPWKMDFKPAQKLHDLAFCHSELHVTVIGESNDSAVVKTRCLPALAAPAAADAPGHGLAREGV